MKRLGFFLVLAGIIFFITLFFVILVKKGRWDGVRRVTIAVNSEPMIIFSLEPATKKAILLAFPKNTLLEVPYGYGTYPASSIFRLGKLEKNNKGGELFTKSVEKTFGVAIEGYFAAKLGNFLLPLEVSKLKSLKQSYFSILPAIFASPKIFSVVQKIDTNLSLIDILRLWNGIRTIRSDKIMIVPLAEAGVLKEETQPDGSKIKLIDKDLLDLVIASNFQDQLIRSENISIEVVNASGKEKLATEFSQILTHMGANVILKSTAEKNEDYSCSISVSKKKFAKSQTVTKLRNLYQCKVTLETDKSSQTDVVVVLGKEFMK